MIEYFNEITKTWIGVDYATYWNELIKNGWEFCYLKTDNTSVVMKRESYLNFRNKITSNKEIENTKSYIEIKNIFNKATKNLTIEELEYEYGLLTFRLKEIKTEVRMRALTKFGLNGEKQIKKGIINIFKKYGLKNRWNFESL